MVWVELLWQLSYQSKSKGCMNSSFLKDSVNYLVSFWWVYLLNLILMFSHDCLNLLRKLPYDIWYENVCRYYIALVLLWKMSEKVVLLPPKLSDLEYDRFLKNGNEKQFSFFLTFSFPFSTWRYFIYFIKLKKSTITWALWEVNDTACQNFHQKPTCKTLKLKRK